MFRSRFRDGLQIVINFRFPKVLDKLFVQVLAVIGGSGGTVLLKQGLPDTGVNNMIQVQLVGLLVPG